MKQWKWLTFLIMSLGWAACAPISDSSDSSQQIVEIQNFTVQATDRDQAALVWDSVKGAKAYKILRKVESSDTFFVIDSLAGNSYSDTISTENYVYKIWAIDDLEQIIGESEAINLKASAPEAPSIFKATPINLSRIHLEWLPVLDASGYKIYRNDGYGYFSLIKEITGFSTHNWTDFDLKSGYTYQYLITAIGEFDRESAEGKVLSIATYSGSNCIVCDFKVEVQCINATCTLKE